MGKKSKDSNTEKKKYAKKQKIKGKSRQNITQLDKIKRLSPATRAPLC